MSNELKNTVLVNVRNNPNKYWGFWYMSDENALNVDYLVSHDNKKIVDIYKIVGRTKVQVLREDLDNKRTEDKYNGKDKKKWTFHAEKLDHDTITVFKYQLKDFELKGIQGVKYFDLDDRF